MIGTAGVLFLLLTVAETGYSGSMSTPAVGKFIIYALYHESSEHVYIGKSTKGLSRPRAHKTPANLQRNHRWPVCKWIMKRLSLGQEYSIAVLTECDSATDLNDAEIFFIAFFRGIGIKLLNCTNGGEGVVGRVTSLETKKKQSVTAKLNTGNIKRFVEMTRSPESRERSRLMCEERFKDPEQKQKFIDGGQRALKNRSPEEIAANAIAIRAAQARPEVRAKMLYAARNKSPEHREMLRIANTGKKMSPEAVEKMSVAFRNRSPESKAKSVNALVAWSRSEEGRKVNRETHLGKKLPPEQVAKISAANTGRRHVGQALENMAAANRTPEKRAASGAARRGKTHRPDSIEKMRKPKSAEAIAKTVATKAANRLQRRLQVVPRFRVNLLKSEERT